MPARRSRRLALKQVSLADLPDHVISRILLAPVTCELLLWSAVCARVCVCWWHIVRSSVSYMMMPHPEAPARALRAQLLGHISKRLRAARFDGELELNHMNSRALSATPRRVRLGDAGSVALGAALQAWPAPLPFRRISLLSCGLTPTGATLIAATLRREFAVRASPEGDLPAFRRELHCLRLSHGVDALEQRAKHVGVDRGAIVAATLSFHHGDEGAALYDLILEHAQATSSSRLKHLALTDNRDLGPEGMAAIAAALPATLETLYIPETGGLQDRGTQAVAAALPKLTRLRFLNLFLTTGPSEAGWANHCRSTQIARAQGPSRHRMPWLRRCGAGGVASSAVAVRSVTIGRVLCAG